MSERESSANMGSGSAGKKLKPGGRKSLIKAQTHIDLEPGELYSLWRHFEQLPQFLPHLVSVAEKSDIESHWAVQVAAHQTIQWDAIVTQELENESISWRSRASSPIEHAGKVHFKSSGDGKSTELSVSIEFKIPGGKMGVMLISAIGNDPELRLQEELEYFKNAVEKHASSKKV